jgi:hypothetical protein
MNIFIYCILSFVVGYAAGALIEQRRIANDITKRNKELIEALRNFNPLN